MNLPSNDVRRDDIDGLGTSESDVDHGRGREVRASRHRIRRILLLSPPRPKELEKSISFTRRDYCRTLADFNAWSCSAGLYPVAHTAYLGHMPTSSGTS
jgi:hypothetical protein